MAVLDSSAVMNCFSMSFADAPAGGHATVHEVVDEMKDFRSKALVDAAIDSGAMKVLSPSKESIVRVEAAATKSGDAVRLSKTDVRVLALALELGEEIWTDDYAIQKVAVLLGLRFKPVMFKGIRERAGSSQGRPRPRTAPRQ